jgi:hypothetical protein
MDSIFDFLFNEKKNYTLIGVDIIEGLDDNFYIVDVNGLIGLRRITQHLDEFNKKLNELFNEDVYFECSTSINNWDKVKIASGNKESKIWVQNLGFSYENKLSWRKKFNLPSPKIENEIVEHTNPDYPKYLLKPEFNFKSRGIELYNNLTNKFPKHGHFLEEFIPSKLIDNHCYNIRVIMIVNEDNHYPILYTLRKCPNPIIKNIKSDILTEEESLSYISNRSNQNVDYELYDNDKLKKFISNLKITV